jgi:hypothetical protein
LPKCLGCDMVLPVVGQCASLVGFSSPLDVVWGFATRSRVGTAHIVVGPAGEQAGLADVIHYRILSSILSLRFGDNGEYNGHTHRKGHKGSLSEYCCCSFLGVCCYFPLEGSGSPSFGFPLHVGYVGVGSGFLMVRDYYCFGFSLSFWHCSTDGMDYPYSVVQNFVLLNRRWLNKLTPACGCPCGEGIGWGGPRNGKYGLCCGNDL